MKKLITRGTRVVMILTLFISMFFAWEVVPYIRIRLIDLFAAYLMFLPVYLLFGSILLVGVFTKSEPEKPYFLIPLYASFSFVYLAYLIYGEPGVGYGWIAPITTAICLVAEARQWVIDEDWYL